MRQLNKYYFAVNALTFLSKESKCKPQHTQTNEAQQQQQQQQQLLLLLLLLLQLLPANARGPPWIPGAPNII